MTNDRKRNLLWRLLGFLVLILLVLFFNFFQKISELKETTDYLNYIEYANASTQRLIKLTLEGKDTTKLEFYLDNSIAGSLQYQFDLSAYTDDRQSFFSLLSDVSADWSNIKSLIHEPEINADALYFAGERHYYHTTDLTMRVNVFIQELSQDILYLELILLVNIFLISAVIAFNLIYTFNELRKSKRLVRETALDLATGLFNRSKCQEVLRESVESLHHKAIVVFDLNDLKKVNDQMGHRAGDELIAAFADVLKHSARIHRSIPFLGRYGGDEFIVFYQDVDEAEVQLYLQEVQLRTQDFNAEDQPFTLSYASGYALSSPETRFETVRQLFDRADQAMYINKVAFKRARQAAAEAAAVAQAEATQERS